MVRYRGEPARPVPAHLPAARRLVRPESPVPVNAGPTLHQAGAACHRPDHRRPASPARRGGHGPPAGASRRVCPAGRSEPPRPDQPAWPIGGPAAHHHPGRRKHAAGPRRSARHGVGTTPRSPGRSRVRPMPAVPGPTGYRPSWAPPRRRCRPHAGCRMGGRPWAEPSARRAGAKHRAGVPRNAPEPGWDQPAPPGGRGPCRPVPGDGARGDRPGRCRRAGDRAAASQDRPAATRQPPPAGHGGPEGPAGHGGPDVPAGPATARIRVPVAGCLGVARRAAARPADVLVGRVPGHPARARPPAGPAARRDPAHRHGVRAASPATRRSPGRAGPTTRRPGPGGAGRGVRRGAAGWPGDRGAAAHRRVGAAALPADPRPDPTRSAAPWLCAGRRSSRIPRH